MPRFYRSIADRKADRAGAILKARAELLKNPVYLDTETTGLGPTAQIVEIGIVDADDTILFESLVKPTIAIPADATRVHGITNAMVEAAPTWADIMPQVQHILSTRRVAIYNAGYDTVLMRQSSVHHGLIIDIPNYFCVMELYAAFYGLWNDYHGSYRWQTLDAAMSQAQLLKAGEAHRATSDSRWARQVLHYLAAQSEF